MNLTEFRTLVSPKAIAMNWTAAHTANDPYVGSALFPKQKKAGLDLSWIKGVKGLPVTLMPSAFDTKATFRDRIGVGKLDTEMPFFREGFKIKEKDRQDILRALDSNDPYAQAIISQVFNDAGELIDGANVVPEREIMQLLFPENGVVGISIQANSVDYTYNYDPTGEWASTHYIVPASAWSDGTNADPFEDIQSAKDVITENGGTAAYAIMNSATFRHLRNCEAIKNRFLTMSGAAYGYLSEQDIVNVLKDTMGLAGIILYDKLYKDESKVTRKFVPDGYVSIIPDGALGNTWYGTTPEEADLMGKPDAEVAIVNTGVAVTQITDTHPVNINTFASEIVLPSFERMNEVVCLKVL